MCKLRDKQIIFKKKIKKKKQLLEKTILYIYLV